MEEKKITERESLELITNMIQQTQQNKRLGSGNILLFNGYTAVVIAIAVYLLCSATHQMAWHNLWFLMFIPIIIEKIVENKQKPAVVTYIDKAISNVWLVINILFFLSVLTIAGVGIFTKVMPFVIMLPLALLYVGIATACTGVITNEKSMMYAPVISFIISIYMLVQLTIGNYPTLLWNLLGGLAFLTMLVVPGHILNRKALKVCSKN